MKNKGKVGLIVAVALILISLSIINPVYASAPNVYGQDFNMLFYSDESIIFQHESFEVNLTVSSGNFSGNVRTFLMYDNSGKLEITANDTGVISVTSANPNARITYNPIVGLGYQEIKWSLLSSYYFPDMAFLIGILGIVGMFISVGYGVYLAKEEEYSKALMTIIMFILCFAFFYSWLSIAGA